MRIFLDFDRITSLVDDVLCPVTEADIPQHLKERFEDEREQDAARKKEKQEAHLFTLVTVCPLLC
jgi:ubiquitin carboxyl-terminal hydrolase 7